MDESSRVFPSSNTSQTHFLGVRKMMGSPNSVLHDLDEVDAEQLPPLLASTFHNSMNSPLCRLPESVIVRIMGHADEISLHTLRRTSRTFFQIFGLRRFRNFHDDSATHWPFFDREPPWRKERIMPSAKPLLRPLIQRDLYCEACRSARPEEEAQLQRRFLHCSGCNSEHPAGLFSYHQRHGPSESRICIGREGHVRVCSHRTINWQEIEDWLARSPSRSWETACHDQSHLNNLSPSCLDFKPAIRINFLSKTGRGNCSNKHGKRPALLIQWTVHMGVPGLGRSNAVEEADLIQRVDMIRRNGGSDMVPSLPGKQPPELQAFDPNYCSCVANWRVESQKKIPPRCPEHSIGPEAGWGVGSGNFTAAYHQKPECQSEYGCQFWAAKKCGKSAECIIIRYFKLIKLAACRGGVSQTPDIRPSLMGWVMALDPDSFHLSQDRESYGIYWCLDQSCLNYHQFHHRNRSRMSL